MDLIKTGPSRELAPYDPDWLYIRAAAIIRHLYFRPNQGINSFRTLYGSKERHNAGRNHHKKAAGGCVRYCLQEFEKLELVEKQVNGGGRALTKKGITEITAIARQISV